MPPPVLTTSWRHVLALRLRRQHLMDRARPRELVGVVGRMVGLHAQVMSSAELQAAARIDGLRPNDVREALWERRTIVKTWAFRQTLHLLTPEDLVEFVVASRSLERWHTIAWLKYFNMTEAEVGEVIDAIGAVLTDRPRTRAEVVDAVVTRLGRPHLREDMLTGWGTFLSPAAQRGQLVFGPSEGRNVAFVRPSAWLARPVDPRLEDPTAADEALGRMIVRYLTVFPGASREMIARWWGGGRMAGVTRALATIDDQIRAIDIEGMRGLVLARDVDAVAGAEPEHAARLLPGFDPFTNELPRRVEAVLSAENHDRVHRTAGWVTPIVVIDGRVAGTWEIEPGNAGGGTVVIKGIGRWRRGARPEIDREVDRIASFLDRPLRAEMPSGRVRR
jgi:hypothetical protein